MVNVPIETKEVVVNINRVLESDITNGVTKDSADPKKEEEEEEGEEKETNAVVLNGSSESILNGDDHDQDDLRLQSDEIKKEDDMITCEEKVKADITPSEEEGGMKEMEGVKEEEDEKEEEAMDTSRDPESKTPEPPEPPEDKGPKLEKAIYEEELVDGFNFCSFETYPEVEVSAFYKIRIFSNKIFIKSKLVDIGVQG